MITLIYTHHTISQKVNEYKYINNTQYISDTEVLLWKGQHNTDNGRQLETKYMLLSKQ